jgi:hypothetical protein
LNDMFNVRRFFVAIGAGLVLLAVVQGIGTLAGYSWTNPPPFPASQPHALLVTQNGDETARPWLTAKTFRDGLDARFTKWEKWDVDYQDKDLTDANRTLVAAFRAAKSNPDFSTPWLIWSDGRRGGSFPLPQSEAETLRKLGSR